jgi:hypothetical protein
MGLTLWSSSDDSGLFDVQVKALDGSACTQYELEVAGHDLEDWARPR